MSGEMHPNDGTDGIYTTWLKYENGEEIALSIDTRAFRAALEGAAEATRRALSSPDDEPETAYD